MRSSPSVALLHQRRHKQLHVTRKGVFTATLLSIVTLVAAGCIPNPINAGNVMQPGEQLIASNGYHADMQANGQLVIIKPDGTSGWHTQTAAHPGASLSVQTDGNLVLHDSDGTPSSLPTPLRSTRFPPA